MPTAESDPRIIEARRIFARYEEALLETGPLAKMADWVGSGRPPPAKTLREAGLTTEGPPITQEGMALRHQLSVSRGAFKRRWGFSIPCREAVEALCDLGPLVEVGAGTGYWSALLRAAGCDIRATDINASGGSGYGFDAGSVTAIEGLDAVSAVRAYPDRGVFFSWPTDGESWALSAAWTMPPGSILAAVLNPGNTGTRGLRRYLATRFQRVATIVIPQFPATADDLTIYRKI